MTFRPTPGLPSRHQMTDERTTRELSDATLRLLAVANPSERGLIIGAVIATAAAMDGCTPRELLIRLEPEMPDDHEWRSSMAGHAARKIRNARRLYRGGRITTDLKRPQG